MSGVLITGNDGSLAWDRKVHGGDPRAAGRSCTLCILAFPYPRQVMIKMKGYDIHVIIGRLVAIKQEFLVIQPVHEGLEEANGGTRAA